MTNIQQDDVLDELRQLKAICGPNKHDQATILISACIGEGLDTRPRIVGALRHLGLDYRHVNIVLNKLTGGDPQRHRWMRDAEGCYSLHQEEPVG